MAASRLQHTRSGGAGLERSCERSRAGWIAGTGPVAGVEIFRAWFAGAAYARHRHDTYAVGVTDVGIQRFDYRGAARTSLPGQVVTLYPDEPHDGRAGTREGFGYRIVYVEPSRLREAVRVLRGRPSPLPFVRDPVSSSIRLSRAVAQAFPPLGARRGRGVTREHGGPRAPRSAGPCAALTALAADDVVVTLAEGLLEAGGDDDVRPTRIDARAVEQARQYLEAARTRVVHSSELEAITGLSRYELARQFRSAFGTSPHRYLLSRRLALARDEIRRHESLATIAHATGFADQPHFTRAFKSMFGLTPARYRSLTSR